MQQPVQHQAHVLVVHFTPLLSDRIHRRRRCEGQYFWVCDHAYLAPKQPQLVLSGIPRQSDLEDHRHLAWKAVFYPV